MAALRSSLRHHRLFSTAAAATTTTVTPGTTLTTSAVKSMFRSENNPDKSLQMYNNLPTADISPLASSFALHHTIKLLAKSRRFDDIQTLVESHMNSPKITEEVYVSNLIRAYGVAGMVDHAVRLYNQMENLGIPKSSISFNTLLHVHNMCKKFDQVRKLFDEIPQQYGFSPDTASYGILTKSLCELRLPESCFPIMKEMEEKNIEVTTYIYTAVVDGLYKKGKIDEAERIWNEMVEKGCLPDVVAYNVRIIYASRGKPEGVLKLIDEMKADGLLPDIVSYNYLFLSYLKNGMVEAALKAYEDLEENGCSPNGTTFNVFVFHLCKKGEFEKAFGIFKESVERNKVQPFPTLKMLAEGLEKISKRKEAKELIATVNKTPSSLSESWNEIEVKLGLSKDEEETTTQDTSTST